jgi:hypothetical protein
MGELWHIFFPPHDKREYRWHHITSLEHVYLLNGHLASGHLMRIRSRRTGEWLYREITDEEWMEIREGLNYRLDAKPGMAQRDHRVLSELRRLMFGPWPK